MNLKEEAGMFIPFLSLLAGPAYTFLLSNKVKYCGDIHEFARILLRFSVIGFGLVWAIYGLAYLVIAGLRALKDATIEQTRKHSAGTVAGQRTISSCVRNYSRTSNITAAQPRCGDVEKETQRRFFKLFNKKPLL